MVNTYSLTVKPRELLGKKSKQLLKQRQIPGNIFGADIESKAISLDAVGFNRLYGQAGDTSVIYVTVEGEKTARPVLVSDVSNDPLTMTPVHVTLQQVNLKEKITATVPVEVVGESAVPDAVLVTVHNEIEVEALPTDLPEKFEIDASTLTEVGQVITFKDLKYDRSKVTIQVSEEELESPVVMLQAHQEEVEEAPAAETPAEGEAAAAPAAPAGEAATEESKSE